MRNLMVITILTVLVSACEREPKAPKPEQFTRIVCHMAGERHEFVQARGTWSRDIGFDTVVIETKEGELSFPDIACTTLKLKS
ncbi:hypothetical protein [Pacificispira sp.]|uniref:hypothetical protein n=1 Tax=Pacificispira sp. TaxID=2888761 RepID=UPI003BA99B47